MNWKLLGWLLIVTIHTGYSLKTPQQHIRGHGAASAPAEAVHSGHLVAGGKPIFAGGKLTDAHNVNLDVSPPRQERNNRLLPDFKPFNHPAFKVTQDDGERNPSPVVVGGRRAPAPVQGPISTTQWLADMFLPVIGGGLVSPRLAVIVAGSSSVSPTPPPSASKFANTLLLTMAGLGGGLAVGYLMISKKDPKEDRQAVEIVNKTAIAESSAASYIRAPDRREPVPQPRCPAEPRRSAIDTSREESKNEACGVKPFTTATEERHSYAKPKNEKQNKVLSSEAVFEKKEAKTFAHDEPAKEDAEIGNYASDNKQTKEMLKSEPVLVESMVNGSKNEIANKKDSEDTVPVCLPATPMIIPKIVIQPVQQEAGQDKTRRTRKDFSLNDICNAAENILPEQDFTTNVKSFKITKSPKFHTVSISKHGDHTEILLILEVLLVQNVEQFRVSVETAAGVLSIEGANTSRLRVTNIEDVDECKSVAKIMTVKEYMCSMANKMIEDAMKRVKEDCSIENIKSLSETIKKYRPESTSPASKGSQGLL